MENEIEVADENEVEDTQEETVGTEGVTNLVYNGINPEPGNPSCIEIVAKKDGKEARVFYNYGTDLEEMSSLFGDDVVFSNARGKMVIGLQAAMRGRLKAGQDIGALMGVYKPGVALERIPTDMNKATEDYFAGLGEDEQDAMIARLMDKKQG